MLPSPPADGRGVRLDRRLLQGWPLTTDVDGDKFSRGGVLVIGGAPATPGAIILAARAALRMGAGRVQIATAAEVTTSVAAVVPEAKVIPTGPGAAARRVLGEHVEAADCVLVGPGASAGDELHDHLQMALSTGPDTVVVVDAAALGVLPRRRAVAGPHLVLTPNRQELDDLLDAGARDPDDLPRRVAAAADALGAVVTSFSTVAAGDGRSWIMTAGHSGLGTSGSGDVLAGLVAGVGARTGDPAQAACWGTLVHALAGERLGAERSPFGFLAHELLEVIDGDLLASG
jgi:ADP-dependent NAD(P)H-hydrate dehydratase